MTLVLRIIRQARWDVSEECGWLGEDDIPADPLADFANTADNCLSVWLVEDTQQQFRQVVAAMAASRDKLDEFDYVLFPHEHLDAVGIAVANTPGETLDAEANRFHRHLIELSANKVVALTKRVLAEHSRLDRIQKPGVAQFVVDAVDSGRVALAKLRPKLRSAIKPLLADRPQRRDKPK